MSNKNTHRRWDDISFYYNLIQKKDYGILYIIKDVKCSYFILNSLIHERIQGCPPFIFLSLIKLKILFVCVYVRLCFVSTSLLTIKGSVPERKNSNSIKGVTETYRNLGFRGRSVCLEGIRLGREYQSFVMLLKGLVDTGTFLLRSRDSTGVRKRERI